MAFRRVPTLPPGIEIPRPPGTYEGVQQYFDFPKPTCGTQTVTSIPPSSGRFRITVSRPAILILHSSVTQQLVNAGDEWQGYYAPEISTGLFQSSTQAVFPLIGGRAAWFFAPGTWIIDITTNSGVNTPSIDYDLLYIDDPTVARTILEMMGSRDQPSQNYNHVNVVVAAGVSTPLENQNVLLLGRGLNVQNIGANLIDLTMDGVAGTGARGIRLLAGAEKTFVGAEYCFTQLIGFSAAGTTVRLNLMQPGWRTF